MVKNLSTVGIYKLLTNFLMVFQSTPLLFLWILVPSSLVDIPLHPFALSNNIYKRLVINLQIYSCDYFTYNCYINQMCYLSM